MSHAVHAVAERIGARWWGCSVGLALATVGCMFSDHLMAGTVCAFVMVFACGVTAGAYLVGRKFD